MGDWLFVICCRICDLVGAGFTNNLCLKLTIRKPAPATVNSQALTIKTTLADRAKSRPVFGLPPKHPSPPEPHQE